MYFLEQIKIQFLAHIALYVGPEGEADDAAEVVINPEGDPTGGDERTQLEEMLTASRSLGERMDARSNTEGRRLERGLQVPADLEVSEYLVSSEEERTAARLALTTELGEGTEVTEQQVREHILAERMTALESNTITDGEREIIESEFIAEIATKTGVDAETIRTLRALGFEGAQTWTPEETAENLISMAESISDIQDVMTQRGIPVPENREAFLALYDYLIQTDEVPPAIDPAAAAAMGIDARRDPNGGFRINPDTPGYTEMPNGSVVGPAGAPSSYNGQVYAGIPNTISPNAGEITYDTLMVFPGGSELTEAQVASLRGTPQQTEANKELIEARFPSEWHDIAIEFANTEGDINPALPIAISSMPGLAAIVSYPGEPTRIEEAAISIGRNGYGPNVVADHDPGSGGTGDRRTQTGRVQHFNGATIAGVGQQASPPSRTILGACIRSPEGQERGGRWWHGGADGRFPGQNSWGCVVANQEYMIRLAQAVITAGGGYGFQSEKARGTPSEAVPETTRTQ